MKNMMWNFSGFEKNLALLDDNEKCLTYGELADVSNEIARHVNERCLVFVMCKNTIGSIIGYIGCMRNNIVPALLSADLDIFLFKELLKKYSPAYIWIPEEMSGEYDDMKKIYSCYGYDLLKTGYETKYEMNEELGLLLTTSGSTGSPKFVRQSYNNVMVNAKQIAEYLKLDYTERPVTTLPMNYTYGCSIINSHLLVGATILVTESSLMTREFWRFMKMQKATSFGGVPYTYEMLEKLRFFRMELPELRYMTQAGGKLAPELHKKFAEYALEKNKKFIVMYGACEATARMGYLPAEKSLEKYGSCGIAIPGGKFSLIDVNGDVIEKPEIVGELVYEGPNVTLGYAENGNDLIKGDERNGRLQTGDMAKRDKDGYYFIVGRKKRFLKIYGNRVNLDEIDRLIKEKFNFIDCASAGKDDNMYIFITDESLVEKVKNFIVGKTKLNAAAFHVLKISEIPKNDAGKILYKELAKYYE